MCRITLEEMDTLLQHISLNDSLRESLLKVIVTRCGLDIKDLQEILDKYRFKALLFANH